MSEKPKYTITDEERQRRRDRALQLHKEGRLGGSKYGKQGGRPKKIRASEIVAQQAQEHADEIVKAMRDGLRAKQPSIRLQAARQWLEVESKEYDLKVKEDRALEQLSTEELVEAIAERFARLSDTGSIPAFDADISDAEELGPAGELAEGTDETEPGEVGQDDVAEDGSGTRGSGTSPFARRTPD